MSSARLERTFALKAALRLEHLLAEHLFHLLEYGIGLPLLITPVCVRSSGSSDTSARSPSGTPSRRKASPVVALVMLSKNDETDRDTAGQLRLFVLQLIVQRERRSGRGTLLRCAGQRVEARAFGIVVLLVAANRSLFGRHLVLHFKAFGFGVGAVRRLPAVVFSAARRWDERRFRRARCR